jgi:hypothetical protein
MSMNAPSCLRRGSGARFALHRRKLEIAPRVHHRRLLRADPGPFYIPSGRTHPYRRIMPRFQNAAGELPHGVGVLDDHKHEPERGQEWPHGPVTEMLHGVRCEQLAAISGLEARYAVFLVREEQASSCVTYLQLGDILPLMPFHSARLPQVKRHVLLSAE